jgi:hypothetical protein
MFSSLASSTSSPLNRSEEEILSTQSSERPLVGVDQVLKLTMLYFLFEIPLLGDQTQQSLA